MPDHSTVAIAVFMLTLAATFVVAPADVLEEAIGCAY
jgi:hypothetical protein